VHMGCEGLKANGYPCLLIAGLAGAVGDEVGHREPVRSGSAAAVMYRASSSGAPFAHFRWTSQGSREKNGGRFVTKSGTVVTGGEAEREGG
jgi:hypothetical protein